VWGFVSRRETDEAVRSLLKIKLGYSRGLKHLDRHPTHSDCWEQDKMAWELMVETLEWLQRRLGSLKVCEHPTCASGRKWFFKIYPNDRYCSKRCIAIAKALRMAKRDTESQKPPKVSKFSEETRSKMSMSAVLRHASKRKN
jgi:hypothetical protein